MDREQKIQFIREKCVEVNPHIELQCPYGDECDGCPHYRTIRLADVLLAVDKSDVITREDIKKLLGITKYETLALVGKIVNYWNLRKDSLTEQDEQTIDFIYTLLGETT